jgi:phage terminase large subunit
MRPHLPSLVREAEKRVAAANAIFARPRVVWRKLDEESEAFRARLVAIRDGNPQVKTILAVVPGVLAHDPVESITYVELVPKLFKLLHPSIAKRYRLATGGRGSGKSHSVAKALILRALTLRRRIGCFREFQNSIRESSHHLLSDQIDALGLSRYFDVREYSITCLLTQSEFLFEGVHMNVSRIKSLEGLDIVWIEQAETISARSWEVVTPTVRELGSEIWATSNPDDPNAPVEGYRTREDVLHEHTTFADNPWFPDVLRAEMGYLQKVDDDAYRHIWLGECRVASDAQIFRGKYVVQDFAAGANWDGPYFGADWGFANDPTTLVRCWIFQRILYIDYEAYAVGVDIDRTPQLFDAVPDARRHTARADSARPETISYMQRNGYPNLTAVDKWTGSVEDGIAHLRQYERIVIHPRCEHAIEEMRLYSYKVDRLTGDIKPEPVDKHNHIIDALRYALASLIKRGGPDALLEFYAKQVTKDSAPKTPISNRAGAVVTPLGGST